MKYFISLFFALIAGIAMTGGSLANDASSSSDDKFPALMSDRLYRSVSREAKEIFVSKYGEEEYHSVELSEENRRVLIEREVVISVLEACDFAGEERMSERAFEQALSDGWSQRQLNYLQSLQAAFGKVAWGLRMLMPCKEKMRLPFKARYDNLNTAIMAIGKGQPQ